MAAQSALQVMISLLYCSGMTGFVKERLFQHHFSLEVHDATIPEDGADALTTIRWGFRHGQHVCTLVIHLLLYIRYYHIRYYHIPYYHIPYYTSIKPIIYHLWSFIIQNHLSSTVCINHSFYQSQFVSIVVCINCSFYQSQFLSITVFIIH